MHGQPARIAQLPRDESGDCSTLGGFSHAERVRDTAVQESVAQLADPIVGKVFIAEVMQCVDDGVDGFSSQVL